MNMTDTNTIENEMRKVSNEDLTRIYEAVYIRVTQDIKEEIEKIQIECVEEFEQALAEFHMMTPADPNFLWKFFAEIIEHRAKMLPREAEDVKEK